LGTFFGGEAANEAVLELKLPQEERGSRCWPLRSEEEPRADVGP